MALHPRTRSAHDEVERRHPRRSTTLLAIPEVENQIFYGNLIWRCTGKISAYSSWRAAVICVPSIGRRTGVRSRLQRTTTDNPCLMSRNNRKPKAYLGASCKDEMTISTQRCRMNAWARNIRALAIFISSLVSERRRPIADWATAHAAQCSVGKQSPARNGSPQTVMAHSALASSLASW